MKSAAILFTMVFGVAAFANADQSTPKGTNESVPQARSIAASPWDSSVKPLSNATKEKLAGGLLTIIHHPPSIPPPTHHSGH